MPDIEFIEENLRYIFLHWVRCMAMLAPIPLFASKKGSKIGKLSFGIALGTIAAFTVPMNDFTDPGMSPLLFALIVKEMLFGALLGFVVSIMIAILRIAGHLIGEEMGFNMANIQDPITGVNVQLMSHFFESIGLVVFFAAHGHFFLMRSLVRSFETYDVGSLNLSSDLIASVVAFAAGIFVSALQLCSPVFVAMLIVAVALAILAKVAPQLQIMQFAFPAKVLCGLLLVAALLPVLVPAMQVVFNATEDVIVEITH